MRDTICDATSGLAAAILLAVLTTGCLGGRALEPVRLFSPQLEPTPATAPLDVELVIGAFSAAPALDDARLLARISPEEIEYYVHHRWVAPPARLLRHELARALRPAFARVELGGPGTHELSAHVLHFEEVDEGEAWFGRVAVRFTLVESATGQVLSRRTLEAKPRADERNPAAVVRALRLGLQEVTAALVADVRESTAPRSEADRSE